MFVKIGDFEVYGYNSNDSEQRHLKYILENNEDFKKYVTKKIAERLNTSKLGKNDLQIDSSYLVKYKSDFVGYIRLENLRWDGKLDIEWAVSPEFQNQKLGTKIVKALTLYIFNTFKEVTKIRGIINKYNKNSISLAKNVGFIETNRDDEFIYVTKSR